MVPGRFHALRLSRLKHGRFLRHRQRFSPTSSIDQLLSGLRKTLRQTRSGAGGCPRFGAKAAPLSHVGVVAPLLPAGASSHPPNRRGRWRGYCVAGREKLPATLNTSRAARGQSRRHSGASAATAAFWYTCYSRGSTATVWWYAWGTRAGCRQCLQLCVSDGLRASLGHEVPRSCQTASASLGRKSSRYERRCPRSRSG